MNYIESDGKFTITPRLTDYDNYYLVNFNVTKHVKRNTYKLDRLLKGRNGYKGEYGLDGEFYIRNVVDSNGNYLIVNNDDISKEIKSITDHSKPPLGQPSLFCPWKPSNGGRELVSVRTDDYNNYYNWLKWLIDNFFVNRYMINGEFTVVVRYGMNNVITVNNNVIDFTYKSTLRTIKTDKQILDDIEYLTVNDKIQWHKHSYGSIRADIKVKENVHVVLFYIIPNNTISIYISKGKKNIYYKTIKDKDKDIKNLIDSE